MKMVLKKNNKEKSKSDSLINVVDVKDEFLDKNLKKDRVIFKKPNLHELTKRYCVVDMHFHTKYSDGINKVKAIAEKAKKIGIGVAITDHNEIKGAIEMDRYKSVFSIPGIEISSKEGTHLLLYFYDVGELKEFYNKEIKPNLGNDIMSSTSIPMESLLMIAEKYKCIKIFPHPYSVAYTGIFNRSFSPKEIDHLLSLSDGVEVINSENLNSWNMKCALLGFNLGKGITGGSDGHTLYHLAKVVSYSDCNMTRKEFLDSVIAGRNKIIGKEIDILRKITSNSFKLKTNIKNYPELVEKNIKYSYTFFDTKTKKLKHKVISKIRSDEKK